MRPRAAFSGRGRSRTPVRRSRTSRDRDLSKHTNRVAVPIRTPFKLSRSRRSRVLTARDYRSGGCVPGCASASRSRRALPIWTRQAGFTKGVPDAPPEGGADRRAATGLAGSSTPSRTELHAPSGRVRLTAPLRVPRVVRPIPWSRRAPMAVERAESTCPDPSPAVKRCTPIGGLATARTADAPPLRNGSRVARGCGPVDRGRILRP